MRRWRQLPGGVLVFLAACLFVTAGFAEGAGIGRVKTLEGDVHVLRGGAEIPISVSLE